MADKEDFTFQDEESFLVSDVPADQVPDQEPLPQEDHEVEPPPLKKTSPLRILLLVLLLVVLGGAAFYYFMGVPEPEPAAPVAVQKKPISMPPPAPPAPAQKPAAVPVPEKTEAPKPAVAVAPAEPQAPATPAAGNSTAPSAKPAAQPAVKPPVVPPAAAVARGAFTLRTGAYLLPSSLASVEKAVRKLGYEPVLTPVRHKVAMTRLKVGSYPPAGAKAELAALAKVAPDAFMLTHDGQATVYAGSYLFLDQARSYADRLYSQGIRVEEEPVQVEETLQSVSFGDFADRQAAQTAAAKAKAAGLDATVVKRR